MWRALDQAAKDSYLAQAREASEQEEATALRGEARTDAVAAVAAKAKRGGKSSPEAR